MAGIRKVCRPTKHEDFRQGDTTEIESLEEHNFPSLQPETTLVGSIPQDATEDWIQREDVGRKQKIGEESATSDNRFMIAFQCISESIQSSLSTLADKTETICSDLDDIVQRLVAVEAAIDTLATETQSTTEEDN
ncbi:hypothetical protein N7520_001750 [Penicillium odoratum]|uniref:uncharacterized protein n=1 Tax=Penicillium odoratum TaxID=1167516 RepID=UPI0025473E18|nr:uncharacterized protein N7520_001750 [Penicillium odoratum]KAJ5778504.1 hypothetical protein N7520_001750 [Penicillium odoratum]